MCYLGTRKQVIKWLVKLLGFRQAECHETEEEAVEVVNLHKEWGNCVMETSDKFESLCR